MTQEVLKSILYYVLLFCFILAFIKIMSAVWLSRRFRRGYLDLPTQSMSLIDKASRELKLYKSKAEVMWTTMLVLWLSYNLSSIVIKYINSKAG